MTTITKERLLTIKQWRETYGPGSNVVLPAEEAEELARIALVSLEAEPVAKIIAHYPLGVDVGKQKFVQAIGELPDFGGYLFAAPPAPIVPEEMYWQDAPVEGSSKAAAYATGWNACRAAMLQGVEPASNHEELSEENGSSLQLRNLIRQRHAEWSDKTFGCVGPVGPLKHLSKEALEAAAEPDDLSEWADMQFLLWDAQRRAGISDAEITAAMENKLKINMERQWPEPKDGEPRLHIKEPGNSPVTPDGWISCSERMPAQDDWILIYSKHGEYMAGQVQGEYVELSDGTLSWLGNALFWMLLPEPPQEAGQ